MKDRLAEALRLRGKNQHDLALGLGYTDGAISQWFREGKAFRDWLVLAATARFLEVSADWILDLSDHPEREKRLEAERSAPLVRHLVDWLGSLPDAEIRFVVSVLERFGFHPPEDMTRQRDTAGT